MPNGGRVRSVAMTPPDRVDPGPDVARGTGPAPGDVSAPGDGSGAGDGSGHGDGPGDRAVPAPWWARLVVVGLAGLLLVAFLAPVRFTFWPVTSWELFSRVRSGEQPSYRVTVVDGDGNVSPMPWDRLGPGHRGWLRTAKAMPGAGAERRRQICLDWANAAADALGPDAVAEVRIARVVHRAGRDIDEPPRLVRSDPYLRCRPS